MEKGFVKWFNNSKGYGFLLAEGGSEDIFVHYSSIGMDGYRTLRTGQPVMFEASNGPKGLQATSIHIITDDAANKPTQVAKPSSSDSINIC